VKFTLSWLRTHLDTDAPLDRLTDTLSSIGLEVEGVEDRAAALAPFRIARVIEAVQHPNADRLRACRVDPGDGSPPVSVVCGAPNARTGMIGVFAPPGSFIPGTGVTLKVGEIRGVVSAGMLLSSREMGLGDDHSGIVELPADAPVGASYAAWAGLDDPVIEIAVTPNRGDALAVRGVARDLAAAGIGALRPWRAEPVPTTVEGGLHWAIEDPEACPWVLGRVVRGLTNGPSPRWLADRLIAIGLRPINALVDITNFFTIDLGRPLHVFDADRITGDTLTLRRGTGEKFLALNGREYFATADDCAIADAAGVQSLAGVMGGEATGSTEATHNVFIECALFDPVRIALTGRRQGIASDARARFERGIDAGLMPDALEAATRMVIDLCGGAAGPVVSAGAPPDRARTATLRFARIADLGGLDVPPNEAVGTLERLGFTVRARDAAQVMVAVPSWRNDIAAPIALDLAPGLDPATAAKVAEGCAVIEPECDLIEEVLRLRGLDTIRPVSLPVSESVPAPSLPPRLARAALVRRTLAARGLAECVTFSFVANEIASLFGPVPDSLRVVNPIAADLDQMRPTPLATLALAAARNAARGHEDVGLFEIGPAFVDTAPRAQTTIAAGLRAGMTPRSWIAPARPVDAMDAKADLLATLAAAGVPMEAISVTRDAPAHYHPGRSATVRQGPKLVLGAFGELHPAVLARLDLTGPAVGFEANLDAVAEPKRKKRSAGGLALPPFQPVRRDFSFVADAATPSDAVLRVARGTDRTLIASVGLFDVYAGEQVPEGKVALGVEVVFQPRERTLTDEEIEAACDRVVAAVAKATGAERR
jgi:phenylalanyl-tRNA synthetase beta chain